MTSRKSLLNDFAQANNTNVNAVAQDSHSLWSVFPIIFSGGWLKNTWKICLAFVPECILPAGLMTFAGLAVSLGFNFCLEELKKSQVLQLQTLVTALLVLVLVLIVCLVCFIWGFTVWLVRLNTFTHAFCMFNVRHGKLLAPVSAGNIPPNQTTAALDAGSTEEATSGASENTITQADVKSQFKSSHAFILKRRKYLARFYAIVSLVALPPIFFWMILCAVKLYSSMGSMSPAMLRISLPLPLDIAVTSSLFLVGVYLVGLSCMSVVVSSISTAGANNAAWDCIKLSFKYFLPMSIISIIILILNVVIATPQFVLNPAAVFSTSFMSEPLLHSVGNQVWQGITSLVLFTISVSPYCALLSLKSK